MTIHEAIQGADWSLKQRCYSHKYGTLKCKNNMPGCYRGKKFNLAGMTWCKQDSEFIWHR